MKGFKKTGNGPRSGFTFPSGAGFGPSSGSVKTVSSYTRRAPKRRAVGGLLKSNVVNTPGGPADFAKGGKVKKAFEVYDKFTGKVKSRSTSGERAMKRRDSLDRKAGTYTHGFSETSKTGK